MIQRIAIIFTILILTNITALAADSKKEQVALSVAQQWLTLIDQENYAQSWEDAALILKKSVQLQQWKQSMQAVRKPLGKLVSRKVVTATYKTALPGAPDGEYVVIQFNTSFKNKTEAVETITPMVDKDGIWRVSGYYIN